MKWPKPTLPFVVIGLLAVTNLITLVLVFNRIHFTKPGKSKPMGKVKVAVERIDNSEATQRFNFTRVPPPNTNDAATFAKFSLLVNARKEENDARMRPLHDGLLPDGPDAPDSAFFFYDGRYGGRILVDLHQAIDIEQVNSYSWHLKDRAPQLYKLYAYETSLEETNLAAAAVGDPSVLGWKLLANVDTRPSSGPPGGQYGVSIYSPGGLVGHYRYLLFDCKRTEEVDRWGNTFYDEIDVISPTPVQ